MKAVEYQCSKCYETKPACEFYPLSGRQKKPSRCKDCSRQSSRSSYQRNREKNIVKSLEWQRTHPEEKRAIGQRYAQKHRLKRLVWFREHYLANREKRLAAQRTPEYRAKERAARKASYGKRRSIILAQQRARAEQIATARRRRYYRNPTKFLAYQHAREAAKRSSGGSFTEAEWEGVKAAQGYACLLCGKREPEIKLTVDHRRALANGGTSNISNICGLCRACNSRKGSRFDLPENTDEASRATTRFPPARRAG